MKTILLIVACSAFAATPLAPDSNTANELTHYSARGSARMFHFSTVPPKKFRGFTRIAYEYNKRTKRYIGYYY